MKQPVLTIIKQENLIIMTEKMKLPPIIPKPRFLKRGKVFLNLRIDSDLTIFCNKDCEYIAKYLKDLIKKNLGISICMKNIEGARTNKPKIEIKLDEDLKMKPEGYHLKINKEGIFITSNSLKGLFYGIQSFRQLLPPRFERNPLLEDNPNEIENFDCLLPHVQIEDSPYFSWRGFMLDDCRHFHGKRTVKKLLEIMASLKMNVFHWHLTEDQGWRIEIKKYPKLTEIGSERKDTQLKHTRSKKFRGESHGGYYTQEDIKEIVEFAKERFIEVVPEIEIPGHSQAAIASYPELGCTGDEVDVATTFGIKKNVYCPGKKKTFNFWYDVLDEVMVLFPSEVIHTGGDEVPKDQWEECEFCQAKIEKENLEDEEELQVFVTNNIASYLASKGRRLMGWNEILDEGLEPNAICHYWAHDEKEVIEHIKNGRDCVVSKNRYTYLNYGYKSLSLEKAYSFSPYLSGLRKNDKKHILGIEAPAWTEWIPDRETLEFQVFPRLLAISEIGWLGEKKPGYKDFHGRLKQYLPRLDYMDVNYANEIQMDQSIVGKIKRFFRRFGKTP